MNQTALPTETLFARATRDFFTHSGHVPLVLVILEALLAKPNYFLSIDPYLLLVAGVSQAFLMAWLGGRSRIWVILGNLSGPLFYSMLEAGIEGVGFFEQSHHQAYWGFALAFGLLQAMQTQKGALSGIFVMAENVLRSAVPVVMYALFEARSSGTPLSVSVFGGLGPRLFGHCAALVGRTARVCRHQFAPLIGDRQGADRPAPAVFGVVARARHSRPCDCRRKHLGDAAR
ncbi:MAG: hypothetical protein IPO13_08315 [Rhodocyclaceae bacterium]|nr:hypothetical protein [Rhodocyclaceae bacterium]